MADQRELWLQHKLWKLRLKSEQRLQRKLRELRLKSEQRKQPESELTSEQQLLREQARRDRWE